MKISDSVEMLHKSLSHRFIVFLFGVLAIVSVSFLLMFYYFYSAQIADERTQASQAVSLLLKSSLERAMLRRDLPGLHDIVRDLGQQEGIKEVMILNPTGEVRFASDEKRLGYTEVGIIREFCPTCTPSYFPVEPMTRFVRSAQDSEILRTFHPVRNKAECMSCHGNSQEHPVNGILVVDYDAAPIRQKGWTNILLLTGSGAIAILFSALAAWWFMQRYVLQPVTQLSRTSRTLSQGDLSARVTVAGQDEMAHLGQVFNHMAERLQHSHKVLKSREQFLQGIIDAVPDGVRVIDPFFQVVVANQAYATLSGFNTPADVLQQYCYRLTYQRDTPCPGSIRTCPVLALSEQQPTLKFMENLQRLDGSVRATEVYAARLPLPDEPDSFLIVESVRDLEQAVQYSHEQKLTALGELAAGVAHEIHNPLASVRIALQASDMIIRDLPQALPELDDYLHLVDEKVEQCLDVTRRLMKLGSLGSNHPELVEVNTVIVETLSLLRYEREQLGIHEQLNLAEGTPRILAADNDLRMIILNLVQNAFHAMPKGGFLTITTLRCDTSIEIHVQDSGVGIAADILPYIFDPFFSRRVDKRGTGLGLTIVQSLVKLHGGTIRVAAYDQGKTMFIVCFQDIDQVKEDAA